MLVLTYLALLGLATSSHLSLNIATLSGEIIKIEPAAPFTVGQLKKYLSQHFDCHPMTLKLILGERDLLDDECELENGDFIVIARLSPTPVTVTIRQYGEEYNGLQVKVYRLGFYPNETLGEFIRNNEMPLRENLSQWRTLGGATTLEMLLQTSMEKLKRRKLKIF